MGFLQLRDVTINDAGILFGWLKDPEAMRWAFSPRERESRTLQEHVDWLVAWIQKNQLSEFRDYWWVLDDEDSLTPLGQIRLERKVLTAKSFDAGLDFSISGRECFVVSLIVDKAHRRKGYGSLMLQIAGGRVMDADLPLLAFIREGNEASVRAFGVAGYRETWRGEWMGQRAVVMEG